MAGNVGGDPEELSILKAAFETQAGRVQELKTTLRSTIANTSWQGPTAEQFRSTWDDYERVLAQLEQALLDAGAEVERARNRLLQL